MVFLAATIAWTWLLLSVAVRIGQPWGSATTLLLYVAATLGPVVAGLIVGIVWTLWHLLLFFVDGTYQHGLGVGTTAFWTFLASLMVQSLVYAFVYVGTGYSIAAVVALHALATTAAEIFSLDGAETIEFALWAGIALLTLLPRWMHSTSPRRCVPRSAPDSPGPESSRSCQSPTCRGSTSTAR